MPSIYKKYSRKRRHSRRMRSKSRRMRTKSRRMRRKSRHSSYNRRRRNMFGGGAYKVTPYDGENAVRNKDNLDALIKLIDLGYVVKHVHPDDENSFKYLTTDKFTSETWNKLSGSFNMVGLSDISLVKNFQDGSRRIVVDVSDPTGNRLFGKVILEHE